MDRITAFADSHGGVFTRSILLEAGITDEVIRYRVRRGRWHRLRPGAYIENELWSGLGAKDRHIAEAHAVALRCASDATFSHVSGAVLRGWPTWNVRLDEVCVTRGSHQAGRRDAGVHHFQAELPSDQVEEIRGLRVASKERLMVDCARHYGFEEAVVICDAALRYGASRAGAIEIFRSESTWPKAAGTVTVLHFADGRAESPGESRLRVALAQQGIIGLEPQVALYTPDGRHLGRVDLGDRTNRVAVEFDGRSKYGIDGKDVRQQMWDEKVREDEIRQLLDYQFVRCYWSHLDNPRRIAQWVQQAQNRGPRRELVHPSQGHS